MEIKSNNYNPKFTSKIKFISEREFDTKMFRQYFYCGKPKAPFADSFFKGVDVWTPEVRTCTAGGVVGDYSVLAFHLLDKPENIVNVKKQFINLVNNALNNTKSALLIGAKQLEDRGVYLPLFEKLVEEVKNITTPSLFQIHKNKYAESNIGYVSNIDTWFINTTSPKNPKNFFLRDDILTLDDLLNSFESIKIAPQDKLFIDGKEITPTMCPEIFDLH